MLASLLSHREQMSYSEVRTEMASAHFYAQSVGQFRKPAMLLAEVSQMVNSLRLTDEEATRLCGPVDCVEMQLRRRISGILMPSTCKKSCPKVCPTFSRQTRTGACSGGMIHLQDYDGFAPLPDAIDDDYITKQGIFRQPAASTCTLAGFIACVQLFPIIADCLTRHRRYRRSIASGKPPSSDEVEKEQLWGDQARSRSDAEGPARCSTPRSKI